MPTTTPEKTTRETWRDLLGPDRAEPAELLTREQVAEQASGIDPVTPDDIRYWEYSGVLPRSVRQWHNGAVRAVYPDWYAYLAILVRKLQRQGLTLDEIKPRVRRRAQEILHMDFKAYRSVMPPDLVAALNAYAKQITDQDGSPVTKIELSILLENGTGHITSVPIVLPIDQQQVDVTCSRV